MSTDRGICECVDRGCTAHAGGFCDKPACATLYRSDMIDRTGTRFCEDCADDALASGVFDS